MHNVITVEVAESKHDLGGDKLDSLLFKPLYLVQIIVDVAAGNILQEKVNPQVILENIIHRIDKWMIRLKQNLLFDLNVFNLILLKHHILVQSFHRIDFPIILVLNEEYLAKRAFINDFLDQEVFKRHLLSTFADQQRY